MDDLIALVGHFYCTFSHLHEFHNLNEVIIFQEMTSLSLIELKFSIDLSGCQHFFIHVNQCPCQRWVQFKLNNFFTAKLNVSFFNGSTLHLEFMGKKWRFKHHGNTQLLFSPPNYGNHLLSNTAKKLDAPCQCPKTQFSRQ